MTGQRRIVTASGGVLTAALASWMLPALGHARALPTQCPSAAAISRPAGVTLTRTNQISQAGILVCSYTARSGGAITFEVAPSKQIGPAAFIAGTERLARGLDDTPKVIRGLGQAAVRYTTPAPRSDPDQSGDTTVAVYDGSRELLIDGFVAANRVVAVARRFA